MKKTWLIFIFLLVGICFSVDARVGENKGLPEKANTFLQDHFFSATIVSVERGDRKEYVVLLSDSTCVKFDKKGKWKSVDFGDLAISTDFFPGETQQKIDDKFHESLQVVKIFNDKKGYTFRLSNGYRLICDQALNVKLFMKPLMVTYMVNRKVVRVEGGDTVVKTEQIDTVIPIDDLHKMTEKSGTF